MERAYISSFWRRHEAQHDEACWALQTQHQATMSLREITDLSHCQCFKTEENKQQHPYHKRQRHAVHFP